MKIELVSCAHVNGLQYYDAHCVIDGRDFSIVPVLYSINDVCWFVKLPDRPLFVTAFYCDLIDYLTNIIRERFNLECYE